MLLQTMLQKIERRGRAGRRDDARAQAVGAREQDERNDLEKREMLVGQGEGESTDTEKKTGRDRRSGEAAERRHLRCRLSHS